MLSLTNGDAVADALQEARPQDTILPWRDVLHEGPVPAVSSADELRRIRARFLADQSWIGYQDALTDLRQRDAAVESLGSHDGVLLWFEHDLYDQLQLLQILDRLSRLDRSRVPIELICIDRHPQIDRFLGLGQLSPQQLEELRPQALPVTEGQLDLARRGWQAFTASDPTDLIELASSATPELPFLSAALRRFLEEYPDRLDGLSRTERQALEILKDGEQVAGVVFRALQDLEEAPFLGDSVFWGYLQGLSSGAQPLLQWNDPKGTSPHKARVALTALGRRVVEGEEDRVALRGLDRWWGGVHQKGTSPRWRWDRQHSRLVEVSR